MNAPTLIDPNLMQLSPPANRADDPFPIGCRGAETERTLADGAEQRLQELEARLRGGER